MFSKNKTAEKCGVALAVVQYYLKTKDMIFYSIDLYDNIVDNNVFPEMLESDGIG